PPALVMRVTRERARDPLVDHHDLGEGWALGVKLDGDQLGFLTARMGSPSVGQLRRALDESKNALDGQTASVWQLVLDPVVAADAEVDGRSSATNESGPAPRRARVGLSRLFDGPPR